MALSSKRSTISNANAAAIAPQYTQEYRTPLGSHHSVPVDAPAHGATIPPLHPAVNIATPRLRHASRYG
jgi:hypothetical protein